MNSAKLLKDRILNESPVKNINILELGVREGISTKSFLEVCKKNCMGF